VRLTAGDTVLVFDQRNRRVSVVEPGGIISRQFTAGNLLHGMVHLLGSHAELIVAVDRRERHYLGGLEYNYSRDTAAFVRVSGMRVDTLMAMPADEHVTWVSYVGGRAARSARMPLPFGHRLMTDMSAGEIVIAATERSQIEWYDPDGRMRRIFRYVHSPTERVDAAKREEYVRKALESAVRRGVVSSPRAFEQDLRSQLALLESERTVPSFDRMLTDSEGHVWLRDYSPLRDLSEAETWTVVSARGRLAARIITPPGLTITHVSASHVTGVFRSELGIEHVYIYALPVFSQ
jgi:hypothetical protein